MRKLYQTILCLYPAEYRAAFASEMLQILEQAWRDHQSRGRISFLSFTVRELTGLATGLVSEWTAKWSARDGYVTARCWPKNDPQLPADVAELQTQLRHALSSMEFAIAHHDFPKARFYSDEERVTRAKLERLLTQYSLKGRRDEYA